MNNNEQKRNVGFENTRKAYKQRRKQQNIDFEETKPSDQPYPIYVYMY